MRRFGILLLALPVLAQQLTWVRTGGPPGGIGYDVRMRLDRPEVMYVTDTFSGVNLSTDGGRTWAPTNQGIQARSGISGDAIPIFTVTVDPHDPNRIWAGTQNVRGVYKSVDAGKTWRELISGFSERTLTFRGITVDPRNSDVVYAAAEISSFEWAGENRLGLRFDLTKGVVYRSLNAGENWTAIWRGDSLARYVLVDPRNSNVIYISTGFFDREPANANPQGNDPGGVGVVKSTDGGRTWRALNRTNGLTDLYIGTLAMHPTNPDVLLAGAGGGSYTTSDSGVFLTTDGGETWRKGTPAVPGASMGGWVLAVDFAPSNPEIAYAATPDLFLRSEDGGRSWRAMSRNQGVGYGPRGMRTGMPVDIQVDPRNPDRLFLNNYNGGNFVTEDGGRTWRVANKGYTGAQMRVAAIDPGDPNRVYTGGRSGIFRTDDAGETWVGLNSGMVSGFEFTAIAADPANPGVVLAGEEDNGALFRSTDGGQTWQLVFQQPGLYGRDFTNRHGFRRIVFAPSNPSTVFTGMRYYQSGLDGGRVPASYGVLKSTDAGRSWRFANDAAMSGQNVNVLAVHPTDERMIYAGTITGGVFVSRDGGQSWSQTNSGLPSRDVRGLAIDPANPRVLYAGLNNAGIYRSSDAGATWQFSSAGLEAQASIQEIVIDPQNPRLLYAADVRTGVYRSEDGGERWVRIAQGLSTRAVWSLAIAHDGRTLYASTDGEGVFRLDLSRRAERGVSAVSAASFAAEAPLAPESIASLFGEGLAARAEQAPRTPLPTALGDASVTITDSAGSDRRAELFFVSPGQINFLVPPGTEAGPAMVRVFRQGKLAARGTVRIEPVAPALFTANADGRGVPAAVAVRFGADGSQTVAPVFRCGESAGSCVAEPLELGPPPEQVVLLLFGTGIRGHGGLAGVRARIGGVEAEVLGATAQGEYLGLDQVNVRLPAELRGLGEVNLELTVNGKAANVVRIRIQ